MENNKKTPSHLEVEKMAKDSATSFQPSIKRWLNKTNMATQQQPGNANKLGACASNQIVQNNACAEIISFENRIRIMNGDYNSKVKSFKKSDETFRIVTTNVNSIVNFTKRQKIWNLLKDGPDILLMTDTRIGEHDLNYYGGNKRQIITTNTDYRGVAFIVKKCFEPEAFEIDNNSGNMAAITFKIAGKIHGMIGIYGPCHDNATFYNTKLEETINKIKTAGAKEIIIAGDMNIQLGKRIGYKTTTSRKKRALLELCDKHNLIDHVTLLASRTKTSPMSFWRRNTDERTNATNEEYQASRLDHVLSTYNADNINTRYTRFYPSDHAVSETVIKIKSREGQTPWRLNRASIDNPIIQMKVIKMADKLTKNLRKAEAKINMSKLSDDEQCEIICRISMSKWGSLTIYTKTITSKWARVASEKRNSEIRALSKCMNNLDIDNETFNEIAEEFNQYEIEKYKIKTELYKFKNKFDNKNLLKFKAQINTSNRTMKKLIIEESVHESDKDIRLALTGYFTSIFSCYCEENKERCVRCTQDNFKYVKNIKPTTKSRKNLSNAEKDELEKEVDEGEVDKYVKNKLKKEGKAPGPDRIPYAFIYKFWPSIIKIVTKIITISLNKNISPKDFAEGLVIFLPKPGKKRRKNRWLETTYNVKFAIQNKQRNNRE